MKVATAITAAGTSEAFFRDMVRLMEEGKVKRLAAEGAALRDSTQPCLFAGHPDWIRAIGAPGLVFSTLARVGKALRFTISQAG